MGLTATADRHAERIEWTAIAVIVVALLFAVRALPIGDGVDALEAWVQESGTWAPVLFGAVYIAAALLCMPASPLSFGAGALFGVWTGLLVISLASTIAAALAFLIARHSARDAIVQRVDRFRRFRAIDRAITTGGARIVALLRLSPLVPFSIGNYLFGLTGVRWLPYVVVSWLFMLPGTFMQVYLGYMGFKSVTSMLGFSTTDPTTGIAASPPTTLEWIALVIGLVATVVVAVYVTNLARNEIAARIDDDGEPEGSGSEPYAPADAAASWPWRATAWAVLALLVVAGALWAWTAEERLAGLFDSPAPTAR
jgi:uncharacterized membrane protein YdjX (TVP38/TMEM64 family)